MTRKLLAIDAGNTSIKVGFFQHGELIATDSFPRDEGDFMPALRAFMKQYPPNVAGFTCAHESDREGLIALPGLGGFPILELNAEAKLPFNHYYKTGRPGGDRLANVMALQKGALPALAIDCGTATNIVIVNRKGDFSGGAILPGIAAQFRVLHEATAGRLPLLRDENRAPNFVIGNSTNDAIRAGVTFGHAGAIDRLLAEIQKSTGDVRSMVISGGGAQGVLPLLSLPVVHVPNLTITGIKDWVDYRQSA